jgi:NTP pyrophosphatase (non-canonical NTP hydrolase)
MSDWQVAHDQDLDTRGFLDFLQEESQKWRDHSFPPEHRTAELQALGICEEAGELAHAVLKRAQGIRGTDLEHQHDERDAVGDIVIYLAGFCSSRGYNFEHCVKTAWYQVAARDWDKHKQNGLPESA